MAYPDPVERSDSFYQSQTRPANDYAKLHHWWGAETASFYSPFKVEFLSRKTIESDLTPEDLLTFKFVRKEELGAFEVDLKDHTLKVWPYHPSTIPSMEDINAAQANNQKLYGFLFLSTTWQRSEHSRFNPAGGPPVDPNSLMEGGGKWPLAGFDPTVTLKEIVAQIKADLEGTVPFIPLEIFDSIEKTLSKYIAR
ncbi:hypothetical protein ACLEPN_23340 [Myxococcus sp. 1LA]